jgi:hypothetical protein
VQSLPDLLDNLQFQDIRLFIDNINQCGESKTQASRERRRRDVAAGRRAAKQQEMLANLRREANERTQQQTVRRAKKQSIVRPIRKEFQRLVLVSEEFKAKHGSMTSDDAIRQDGADIEKEWMMLAANASKADLYGTIRELDNIAVAANRECDIFHRFVIDSNTPSGSIELDTDMDINDSVILGSPAESVILDSPVQSVRPDPTVQPASIESPAQPVISDSPAQSLFDDSPIITYSEAQEQIKKVVNNPSTTPLRRTRSTDSSTPNRRKRNWADIGTKSFTFSETQELIFRTPSRRKPKSRRTISRKSRGANMRDIAAQRADAAGKASRAERAATRPPPSRNSTRKHIPKVRLPSRNRLASRMHTRSSRRTNTRKKNMAAMQKELMNIPEPSADDVMHHVTSAVPFDQLRVGSIAYDEAVSCYYVTTRSVIQKKYAKLGCKYD